PALPADMALSADPHFKKLVEWHKANSSKLVLRQLFEADKDRFQKFRGGGDILLDYGGDLVTEGGMKMLMELGGGFLNLDGCPAFWMRHLRGGGVTRKGGRLNFFPLWGGRAVLGGALRNRSNVGGLVDGRGGVPEVNKVGGEMKHLGGRVRGGEWKGYTGKGGTDVVRGGIGGSDLGPLMVRGGLKPYGGGGPRVWFVGGIDGTRGGKTLAELKPDTTLFIIASKTFTGGETITNAETGGEWFLRGGNDVSLRCGGEHMLGGSNSLNVKGGGFSISGGVCLQWVGGGGSLWSGGGLSIALHIGGDSCDVGGPRIALGGFLCVGGDNHFHTAPLEKNVPVLLAMLGVWYGGGYGCEGGALLPYDQWGGRFAAGGEQGDMESNGKYITRGGSRVDGGAGPIVWGEPGTNGQHAFYQLIHQVGGLGFFRGGRMIPCDFGGAVQTQGGIRNGLHHRGGSLSRGGIGGANFLAGGEALMKGKRGGEARKGGEAAGLSGEGGEKLLRGGVPRLRGAGGVRAVRGGTGQLGGHKIWGGGVVWGGDSYDQWGVELGKQLAKKIEPELESDGGGTSHDGGANGLINFMGGHRA
ncbi:G6PI isomerase, partial [Chloropsis hardwickii]|nr:G6PI isomerase [Chloropsis hardwickii]